MVTDTTRRELLAALAATALLPTAGLAQPPQVRRRFLLNSGYSGAQSWFFLAEDAGYFRRAGISLDFTTGLGAYKAAPRMAEERFDIAFGDIYSMIEVVATSPPGVGDHLPIAVYAMFNRSPSMIAVDASGPIRAPRDLAGRRLIGHDRDVALETFPAVARATGLDPATVDARPRDATMADMLRAMLAGEVGGVFGYVTTATAHAAAGGIDMSRLRFIRYADHLPDFYGHALMVSRRLVRSEPGFVSELVRAVNLGLRDAVRDPDAGIATIARRDPTIRPEIERGRLLGTFAGEMSHPEGAALGIGAVNSQRLERSIALHAETKRLPRTPALREIFNAAFLPAGRERVRQLAQGREEGDQIPLRHLP